ncbi:6-hydroxymethylpterin diphosphokinase MptE-like protein [Treponema socranskii]|uniref:6-hydroxymethylpterin diphosphokinase MptE-like protein n=1 Tax=Treponema socranskii TaxID=53419 RepID=UPI003D89C5BE
MGIRFFTAKSGLPTCAANGTNLHSSYDPEREAERFVDAMSPSFNPQYIVVTEPALSYCAQFFRKRFPAAVLVAVRYAPDFAEADKGWDIVFDAAQSALRLSDTLFDKLGEEGLCSALFASWQPSARAFPEKDAAVWREIKHAVDKGRDVLFTRSCFASRWIANAFFICRHIERARRIVKGSSPVVVAASGPSLKSALPCLAQFRPSYFLIAASSALSVLTAYGIIPDLCIATDGGFYAKAHLSPLSRFPHIPLALAQEASCSGDILSACDIIPLSYGDGFAANLFAACGIPSMKIERNGTVSGSALDFARSITDGSVFLCGLDMAPASGLQHAQPNVLEEEEAASYMKTYPNETKNSASRFASGALELYRKWFRSLPKTRVKNVYRFAHDYRFSNTLGAIADVDAAFFERSLSQQRILPRIADEALPKKDAVQKAARDFLKLHAGSDAWLHEIFPAEYVSRQREPDAEKKEKQTETLAKKSDALSKKIARIIG